MGELPACIWITGLAGSGKTTLAEVVVSEGRACGEEIVWLDGDLIRDFMGARTAASYTQEGRKKLSRMYGELCSFFVRRGFSVVISTVSMHPGVSEWNRKNIPGYFEVFLSVPATTLLRRNKNNMYSGLTDVVGLDIAAKFPKFPDLTVQIGTSGESVNAIELAVAASKVLERTGIKAGS